MFRNPAFVFYACYGLIIFSMAAGCIWLIVQIIRALWCDLKEEPAKPNNVVEIKPHYVQYRIMDEAEYLQRERNLRFPSADDRKAS